MRYAVRTALVVLALAWSVPVAAVIFPVTKVADTADGACNADCSLREAISAANAAPGPDTVVVPAGTYTLTLAGPSEDLNASGDLDITGDLTISGAGAATTFVDGNAITRVFHVVSSATLPVTITGLAIRNGGSSDPGGGVANTSSTAVVTVDSCIVTGHVLTGGGRGGGLYNDASGSLIVTNSTISNNIAPGNGGGIGNNANGTLTVTNCIVTGNSSGDDGGGIINNFDGSATVTGSVVSGNTTSDNGGGLNNNANGTFTVVDTTISGNTSTGSGGGGGGFTNNFGGAMTVTGSTISGNSSAGSGGGVDSNANGPLTITNSTISGNTDTGAFGGGGGLYKNFGAAITLTNVTIIGNSSLTGGSNIENNNPAGSLSLRNTIVANPASGSNCAGPLPTSLGNNLASDASCNLVAAGDLPNTNPLVGPLANNGGPTLTHALLVGSPAIDAAGGCPPPATDQRGVVRPQGPACDIGSFEAGGVISTATPTSTPTVTSTPTNTPPGPPSTATFTPTLTPTPTVTFGPGGPAINVPTLSGPLLALLGLVLAAAGFLLLRRI